MTERNARNETTGRFVSYKEQVGAVEHFLGLNGLSALNFKLDRDTFLKYRTSIDRLIPICLRDFGKSSTTVFIKDYEYNYDKETLTVKADELRKYIK
jgi:hypothetical protein